MTGRDTLKILLGALAAACAIAAAVRLGPSAEARHARQLHQGRVHFAERGVLLLRGRAQGALQFASIRVMGDDGPICYTFRAAGGQQDQNAVLNDDRLIQTPDAGFAPLWQQQCVGKPGEDLTSEVALALAQPQR